MKRIFSVAAFTLLGAAALAAVAPLVVDVDLTRMPADPATREQALRAMPVSLVQAIQKASADGGIAGSASVGADGQVTVALFQQGLEHSVVIDGKSGEIVSKKPSPRFPGAAVEGTGVTTPSGLLYYDLKAGDGAEAIAKTSNVKVHYTGYLLDGSKFDSSVDRGEPFSFNLKRGVIEGWLEGVAGMKVGGKRKLVIPANLGYGDNGYPPVIPKKAVLVFDIELLSVQ